MLLECIQKCIHLKLYLIFEEKILLKLYLKKTSFLNKYPRPLFLKQKIASVKVFWKSEI